MEHPTTTARLGEILKKHGLVNSEQLDQTLDAQVVFGGRLGTNLVELSFCSLDDVGRGLSIQQGIPLARHVDLYGASESAIAVVSKKICAKYGVYPLRVQDRVLDLAMLDPLHLTTLDELSFLLNLRIRSRVVPELRLLQVLEDRYGIKRESRFLRIPDAGEEPSDRRTYLRSTMDASPAPEDVAPALSGGAPATASGPGDSPPARSADLAGLPDLELVYLDDVTRQPDPEDDEDDFEVIVDLEEELPGEPVGAPAGTTAATAAEASAGQGDDPRPPSPATTDLPSILSRLETVQSRSEIFDLLIERFLPGTSVSALFMIRGEMAIAIAAGGAPASPAEVAGLVLALATPSLFQQAMQRREVVRAAAAEDPVQQMISRYLRTPEPRDACVAPICLGERVVNLLCVQSPSGEALPEDAIDELGRLSAAAARSYARLIRSLKQQQNAPGEEK